ncbi:unnamed protein product [Linum trigynum]|uniref:Uncharacterized protein n=1 Tax=Linum trigynum TaxID=586398 RepID=A0AAV2ES08_9ROSI
MAHTREPCLAKRMEVSWRLAGEAVDDGDESDFVGGRERGPPLGEELEAAGVGPVLRVVGDVVFGVEFGRGEIAKGSGRWSRKSGAEPWRRWSPSLWRRSGEKEEEVRIE